MSHRWSVKYNKVCPKPSARDRTWYRWRMRKGMMEQIDQQRFEKHQGVLSYIKEKLIGDKKK